MCGGNYNLKISNSCRLVTVSDIISGTYRPFRRKAYIAILLRLKEHYNLAHPQSEKLRFVPSPDRAKHAMLTVT